MARSMRSELVGAFGEKTVEAELLRRGWLPANANASVKNAADFDIFAQKGMRVVPLRVKTSGPKLDCFQYNFGIGKDIDFSRLNEPDFTILVAMGNARDDDRFYV